MVTATTRSVADKDSGGHESPRGTGQALRGDAIARVDRKGSSEEADFEQTTSSPSAAIDPPLTSSVIGV